MREEGIPFGEEKTIVFKMHINGSSKEMSEKAEEIVNSIISKAQELTNYSSIYEEITKAVGKILDHIRNIHWATLLSSERSCILLTFTCTSYCVILSLLDCFERNTLKEQMFDLAQSLSFYLSDEFNILATVSPTSIVVLQEMSEVKTQGCYVPIKVSCATVSSLDEVYRCFDATAVNSTADVKNLANVLSRELNDTYHIQISADIGTKQHLLLEEKDGSNSCKPKNSENAMEMADEMPILYKHIQTDKATDGATGCSADDEVHRPDIDAIISKGKCPINSLNEINVGDVFEHQILVTNVQVDDNDTRRGSIEFIHFRFPSIFTITTRNIVREQMVIDLKRDSLYRANYYGGIFSTEEAISRANKRIGERKLSTSNRFEHFCFWAKVKPITNKADNSSLKKPSSRSMSMKEIEIHLAEELQEGDVIYFKSDGILVNIESLDGGIGRRFRIEKVAYDEYDYIVRKKHYNIDLNTDFISVKKYSSSYCVSMTERVKRALNYVGVKGKWWSRNEFIKYCIKESRYD
ncbi:uncharacterized protein LOC132737834 [Ruditapes philippinarum]|uniref:uncharacterized protein LOC132737834 n=1 Tax=Ruditapes philippinarum TaxID=129788 RepID=UPI00295A5D34|nr:uncharacterized protein LOC132737834 [Ruditapes philippinarum]